MINDKEKIKLKEFLPHNYISLILKIIEDKEIVKQNGKTYSSVDISRTLNDSKDDPLIERLIFDVASKNKKLIEARDQSKHQFLSTQSK